MGTLQSIIKSIFISLGLLFTLFLVLKLTSLVDWSWSLVTLPIWLPVVLFFFVGTFIPVILVLIILIIILKAKK